MKLQLRDIIYAVIGLSALTIPLSAISQSQHITDIRALDVTTFHSLDEIVYPLVEDVRDIQGLSNGVGGGARAIEENVVSLLQAITDLKAEVTEHEIRVDLSADVLFDFDKSSIKPEAEKELKKASLIIREKRKGEVMIYGHTDAKGSDDYNQKLSEQRAISVRNWLVKNGAADGKYLKAKGFGESQPVAPNSHSDGSDNVEGRAKNRRVQIVIKTSSKA